MEGLPSDESEKYFRHKKSITVVMHQIKFIETIFS